MGPNLRMGDKRRKRRKRSKRKRISETQSHMEALPRSQLWRFRLCVVVIDASVVRGGAFNEILIVCSIVIQHPICIEFLR